MNQVSRRSFIKNAGGASVALWLGLSNKFFEDKAGDVLEANFTPYIIVESNGNITLFNTKPEMGQGTFQSIPALIAEEFQPGKYKGFFTNNLNLVVRCLNILNDVLPKKVE